MHFYFLLRKYIKNINILKFSCILILFPLILRPINTVTRVISALLILVLPLTSEAF